MSFDYFVFYTEASIICVVVLSLILIADRAYNILQEKQLWFHRSVISFILYFVSDAFWAAMLSNIVPKIRFFAVLFNFTNLILMHFMACGLFMFIAVSEKLPFRNDKKKRYLSYLPMLVSILFFFAAYATNPLFWIDEEFKLNTLYFLLMFMVPSFYLWAALFFSVKNARSTESKDEKRRYLIIGSIPMGVMAFGLVQVLVLNAPTFCFGCTIMWLWFYIQDMKAMISVDDLTRLNNRRQINRYMEQLSFSEDSEVAMMMIDINQFKKINDTYGHSEGDRALVITSEALRQAGDRIDASVFLGRYGGDEFTVIIRSPEKHIDPGEVIGLIRRTISERGKEYGLPYELKVGVGYDTIKDENDTPQECLKRADEKLYIDKKNI
ncbi:MAG: GGDEF domain-containing protein [Lachnospiraceae bacterium]|nr:GGDEF domain-containing protein [Lachnospiraceae bacterium]